MESDGKIFWTLGKRNKEIELLIYDQEGKMLAIIPFEKILDLFKDFK